MRFGGMNIGWREGLIRSENRSFRLIFDSFHILSELKLDVDTAVLVDGDPANKLLAGALPLHVVHLRPGVQRDDGLVVALVLLTVEDDATKEIKAVWEKKKAEGSGFYRSCPTKKWIF